MRTLPCLAFLLAVFLPQLLFAEPVLQLYLEGGSYDSESETWVLSPPGSSNGAPFRIWAIGNTIQGNTPIVIEDVKLAVSYSSAAEADGPITITLTPSTMGGTGSYLGFTEGSAVTAQPQFIQKSTDGSTPKLGDGSNLPSHDVYGEGTYWQEFLLGDFGAQETLIGDFTTGIAGPGTHMGQINVYDVTVTGSSIHPTLVHFDLYNHFQAKNKIKYVFAPFSHDAEGTGGTDATAEIVPVPSSALLVLTAVLGLGGISRFRRRSNAGSDEASS